MRSRSLWKFCTALLFVLAALSQGRLLADGTVGGCEYYNQGGCGCTGWITINCPLETELSCDDQEWWINAAAYACQQECGYASWPGVFGSCDSNEYSSWQGFKCVFLPCGG